MYIRCWKRFHRVYTKLVKNRITLSEKRNLRKIYVRFEKNTQASFQPSTHVMMIKEKLVRAYAHSGFYFIDKGVRGLYVVVLQWNVSTKSVWQTAGIWFWKKSWQLPRASDHHRSRSLQQYKKTVWNLYHAESDCDSRTAIPDLLPCQNTQLLNTGVLISVLQLQIWTTWVITFLNWQELL